MEMKPLLAHMKYCNPKNRPSNLINHSSDYDGIIRSEKACYIIEKFNPQNAAEIAMILDGNRQWVTGDNRMVWYYPMFWEDKKLVKFCEDYAKKHGYDEGFIKGCVGYIDDVDISADIWELSPTIRVQYPTVSTFHEKFKNSRIILGGDVPYEGWHELKKDIMSNSEMLRKSINSTIKVDLNKKFYG